MSVNWICLLAATSLMNAPANVFKKKRSTVRVDANATDIFRYVCMYHTYRPIYIHIYIYTLDPYLHLYPYACALGDGAKFKKSCACAFFVWRDLFTNLNKLCTQNDLNYHERRRRSNIVRTQKKKRGSEITALFALAKSISLRNDWQLHWAKVIWILENFNYSILCSSRGFAQ